MKLKPGPQTANNSMLVNLVRAWLLTGTRCRRNFSVSAVIAPITIGDLRNEWALMDARDIEWHIMECEQLVKSKRPYTAKEAFVAAMGRKVLQHRNSSSSSPACVVYVDNLRAPIALHEFLDVASLTCRTFCPLDGHIVEFPLLAWREQRHYLQYTLVLYGDSSLGKTQLASSLLASISGDIWQTPEDRC